MNTLTKSVWTLALVAGFVAIMAAGCASDSKKKDVKPPGDAPCQVTPVTK